MERRVFSKRILVSLIAGLALTACGKVDTVSDQIASDTNKFGACESYPDKVRTVLTANLIEGRDLPTVEEFESTLRRHLDRGGDQNRLADDVVQVYRLLTAETANRLQPQNRSQLLAALVALEIGDHTTPERGQLSDEIKAQFAHIRASAVAANGDCAEPVPTPSPVISPEISSKNPVLAGALRVMTTAYQGCQALRLPAMTGSTPDVQGITITGHFPGGGEGLTREITNLAALNKTHYYVKEGSLKGSTCFDVAKKPLIYDFGGKPYATADVGSSLDFFRDAGEGTAVLGMDCSGFVFSSLAAQGLRAVAGKPLKASQVYGISAAMMMNPQSNGVTCLAAATMDSNPLRSGDILATSGHVVILDATGTDPFGLARAKTSADCTSSKLTSSGFDFDVLQSSPVKAGIGIDRIRAPDYLATSSTMRSALVSYAVSACKVRFGGKPDPIPSTGHIVRHKGTPDCLDKPIALARESCVSSCYAGSDISIP